MAGGERGEGLARLDDDRREARGRARRAAGGPGGGRPGAGAEGERGRERGGRGGAARPHAAPPGAAGAAGPGRRPVTSKISIAPLFPLTCAAGRASSRSRNTV